MQRRQGLARHTAIAATNMSPPREPQRGRRVYPVQPMESSMLYMPAVAGLAACLLTFLMSGAIPGFAPLIADVAGLLLGLSAVISAATTLNLDI
jgi:hypothetical protein